MFKRPDPEDIAAYGEQLGLGLSAAEVRILRERLVELVDSFEQIDELRIPEDQPPVRAARRDPGVCPSPEDDPLNAYIRKCRVESDASGPLSGKSVGLKDSIAVAGVPLSLGVRFLEHYVPDFDATVVTRLLDAGATIAGKMNMDAFSVGGYGWGGVGNFGRTRHPRDPSWLVGGSSQGSAVAVAAGELDLAFGGDQAGSIRLPASLCGIVGLKATRGLIPYTGIAGVEQSIDYTGPYARTVREVALVLDCVAGVDGYDPRQAEVPRELPDYSHALEGGVEGLRVGVLAEGFGFEGSEPGVEAAVNERLAALERAGARLEEVSVPLHAEGALVLLPLLFQGMKMTVDTGLGGAFATGFYPTSLITAMAAATRVHGHELPPNMKLNLVAGAYLQEQNQGRLYAKVQNLRRTFSRQYEEALSRVDVLAMPTCPFQPRPFHQPSGYEEALGQTLFGTELAVDLGVLLRNTAPFNYTGHPAISVPCGEDDGRPVGVQFVSSFFREDLLLRAGEACERVADALDRPGGQ
jgi:amidase